MQFGRQVPWERKEGTDPLQHVSADGQFVGEGDLDCDCCNLPRSKPAISSGQPPLEISIGAGGLSVGVGVFDAARCPVLDAMHTDI